jgi:hypothetical protein
VHKLALGLRSVEFKLSVLEQDKVQQKGFNGFAMKKGVEAQKLRFSVFQHKKAIREIFLDLTTSYEKFPPVSDDGDDMCSACGGEEGKLLDCVHSGCFRSFHPVCQFPPVDAEKVGDDDFFCHMCKTIDSCLEDLSVTYGHSLPTVREFETAEEVFLEVEGKMGPPSGVTGEEDEFLNQFCGSDYDEEEDSEFDESEFVDQDCSDIDSGSGSGSGDDDNDDDDEEEEDDEEDEEDSCSTSSIDASLVQELGRDERELYSDLRDALHGADTGMFGRSKRRGVPGTSAISTYASSHPAAEDDDEDRELIAGCKALQEAKRATDQHLNLNNLLDEKAHGYSTRCGNDKKAINFELLEAQIKSTGAALWADDEDDEVYGEEELSKNKRKRKRKNKGQDQDQDQDQGQGQPIKKIKKPRRASERKKKTLSPIQSNQTVIDLTGSDDEDE